MIRAEWRRFVLSLTLSSSDSGAEQYVTVDKSPFTIGRLAANDLVVSHPEVSGKHAQLVRHWDQWSLSDLGSTNGTFVNGVPISGAIVLGKGAILHFGSASYRVVDDIESSVPSSVTVNAPETLARIRGVVEVYRIIEQERGRTHFQPIISIENMEPLGWEALGRAFPLPTVDTGTLFELAAMDQIAAKLSRVFFHRAKQCLECGNCWPRAGRPHVFLNLHPEEILTPRFKEFLADLGGSELLNRYQFVLEFPESLADKNREMQVWMRDVRAQGILVAFDDFAKGQSRISDLVTSPPDFLKLDRELICGVCAGGPKETLLRGVVDTCRETGVQIIAEGVELEAELEACRRLGIRYVQGFLLARPAPAFELFGVAEGALPVDCPFHAYTENAVATA